MKITIEDSTYRNMGIIAGGIFKGTRKNLDRSISILFDVWELRLESHEATKPIEIMETEGIQHFKGKIFLKSSYSGETIRKGDYSYTEKVAEEFIFVATTSDYKNFEDNEAFLINFYFENEKDKKDFMEKLESDSK